ncbi:MAG: metal ABC transporter permease [Thermoprotei archaeon]
MSIRELLILYSFLALTLVIAGIFFGLELKWLLTFISLGLIFGFLSPIIAARRLYYLSAAAPHSTLFSVALSIIVTGTSWSSNYYLVAVAVSVFLMLGVGYMVRSGVDPDVATSVFVAGTTASSVLILYYVSLNYRMTYSVNALILGDPLLISHNELLTLFFALVMTAVLVVTTFRENVCAGVDIDLLKLSGVRLSLYDLVPYSLLGFASVVLLRLVGYVMSHVMILLPSLISMNLSKRACGTLAHSAGLSTVSALSGLLLSARLNISPSGSVGLFLTIIYLITFIMRRYGLEQER